MLPDEDEQAVMRNATERTRAGAATSDESGAAQPASTRPLASKKVVAASRFAIPHSCDLGLRAN